MMLKPRVYKATEEFVPVGVAHDIQVTVVRGQSGAIEKNVELRGKLLAPLPAGTTVGQLTIKSGGLIVAQVPLVTLAAVQQGGLLDSWVDTVKLWLQ